MRHNGVRDLEGKLMKEVCKDVKIEPALLPVGECELSGNTQVMAKLGCVWCWSLGNPRTHFFRVVFHPNCATYINMDLERAYVHHKNIKKNHYKECVLNVEHGLFTPIIFPTRLCCIF